MAGIEDAQILSEVKNGETTIPEPQQPSEDLQARLKKLTQIKTPGTASAKPEPSSFWEQSDDDFAPVKKPEAKTAEEKGTEEKPAGEKKLTDKMKMGSAKTATNSINFSMKLLVTPVHNYKLKKKIEKRFTEAEQNKLDAKIAGADDEIGLDDEEIRLKRRFDSIMKKHEKKINSVEMTEPEKEDMQAAWYAYFDYYQKELSPVWYLLMESINTVGKRMIDAFTTD